MFTAATEPLVGYNTVPADDAVATYSILLAVVTYEAVTAYDAV